MSNIASVFNKQLHQIPKLASTLAIPGAKVGIEVEVENCRQVENLDPIWQHKPDHSLRNDGMEFVSNGGLVGEQIITSVNYLCEYIRKNKFDPGYPRAGIHIHLDVTDMNGTDSFELARMMQTAMILEAAMFGFAGEHRRACGFCDAFGDSSAEFDNLSTLLFKWGDKKAKPSVQQLLRGDNNYLSKYQAINLLPISTFGTVEYRHLPTTFDEKRIVDWINVILCLKKYAQSEPNMDVIKRAQQLGGPRFFDEVLGPWVRVLGPHYTDKGFEEGLITAQLIRLKSTVKPFIPKLKPEDWPGKPSKILEAKLKKVRKGMQRSDKEKLNAEAAVELPQPQLADPLNPFAVRWNAAPRLEDPPAGERQRLEALAKAPSNAGVQIAPEHREVTINSMLARRRLIDDIVRRQVAAGTRPRWERLDQRVKDHPDVYLMMFEQDRTARQMRATVIWVDRTQPREERETVSILWDMDRNQYFNPVHGQWLDVP